MSTSNLDLKVAAARQKRFYLLFAIGLLGAFLLLFALLGATNGTSVEVLPAEAASFSTVRLQTGLGFTFGSKVYSLTTSPEIIVSAEGYKPEKRIILPNEVGGKISILLRELPGRLIVQTNTDSDRTHWSVNDHHVAIARKFNHELEAGSYNLEIDNPYFQKQKHEVHIQRQEEKKLQVDLVPVVGNINIGSDPSGAVVNLNGVEVGSTPLQIEKNGGGYQVEITHPNYVVAADTIEITNQQSKISRNYKLSPKTAFLKISLDPPGGDFFLNGKRIGPSKWRQKRLVVPSMKTNTLYYSKNGFLSETQKISLKPNQERSLLFQLNPELGTVNVQSRPKANVYIDGKIVGETPVILELLAIQHDVEIRKPGYRSVKKKVTPSPKVAQQITVSLRTELQARLSEAPKEYKNSAGVELKLFFPTKFLMGAPRSEPGQRANEFLRHIELKKPFYAGKFEVTQEQFSKFKKTASLASTSNIPVTSISWLEAISFCNWLSFQENLKPFYVVDNNKLRGFNPTSDGYRLLTEAEWEWLSRKALRSKQTKFSWGDDVTLPPMTGNIADENAKGLVQFYVPNYNDGFPDIAPVGSFNPEKSGLFDLVGNVSEWVHDFYSLVPPSAKKVEVDPLGPKIEELHVLKGSNWRSGTLTELRASFREGLADGRDDIGFRVARYLYGGANAKN
jgi:formylglycine-generating enzyme required for sulfatase activity